MREADLYARWLDVGVRLALAALVLGFGLYVFGVLEALVPPQELLRFWHLPAEHYVAATGAPTGWRWLAMLAKGDYLNFVGIALLAGITLACYARIIPPLAARGERLQAALAAAQLLVLVAALSGVLA